MLSYKLKQSFIPFVDSLCWPDVLDRAIKVEIMLFAIEGFSELDNTNCGCYMWFVTNISLFDNYAIVLE